jgi:hypothetical protein
MSPARCKVMRRTVRRDVTVTMPSCFMGLSPQCDTVHAA